MFETNPHCQRKHTYPNWTSDSNPTEKQLLCQLQPRFPLSVFGTGKLYSVYYFSHSFLSCLMLLFMNVMTFLPVIQCVSGENCCPSLRFTWIQQACITDSRGVRLHSNTLSLFAPPHHGLFLASALAHYIEFSSTLPAFWQANVRVTAREQSVGERKTSFLAFSPVYSVFCATTPRFVPVR